MNLSRYWLIISDRTTFNISSMKTIYLFYMSCAVFLCLLLSSCEHEGELMPGTPNVCFDRDVMLIINSNCNISGCHGSGGEAPALSTYEDVTRFVIPFEASKSELHKVVTANNISPNLMPPKPKSRLTSEQIDIINIWILQGALHTTCP